MITCVFVVCLAVIYAVPSKGGDSMRKTLTQEMMYQKYKNPYAITRNRRTHHGWLGFGNDVIIYFNSSSSGNTTQTTEKSKKPIEHVGSDINDMDNHLLAIKVAAIFRNNLIRVFGYILHRREMELNSELYTSLYFILSTIKLNQVNIISMIHILEGIAFKTSNERFSVIFGEMQKNLPVYLACAAGFWKEAITNKQVNMDNILKPDGKGPLRVDVFKGLNDEILGRVAIQNKQEGPKNTNEKKVMYNFNMDIVQIMRYIQQHKTDIQQLFVGALVLFFPRNVIQPDLEESIEVLIEFLQQNEVSQWKTYVSKLNSRQLENPYDVVRELLGKLILDNNSTTVVVKESLQIILNNLVSRNPTAINPNYNSISNFVQLDEIKMTYMLHYITIGAYPIEIVLAAYRVAHHLQQGHIKHITLFTYFNPYFYSSPVEIFIALLERIIKRQPDLPAEVIDAVGAVYGYVVFTHRYITFPATMPDDMLNTNTLILGTLSPDLERIYIQQLKTIGNSFTLEHINFQSVLKDIPVYKCATPTDCFYELIIRLRELQLVSSKTQQELITIRNNSCFHAGCHIVIWQHTTLIPRTELEIKYNESANPLVSDEITFHPTTLSGVTTRSTPTTTVLTTVTAPTEGPVSTPTTLKPTSATPPTTVSLADVHANMTKIMPPDPTALLSIVKLTAPENDVIYVKAILRILKSDEFKVEYSKMAKGKQLLIITSMLNSVELTMAKNPSLEIDAQVRKYFRIFMKTIKHVQEVLKLITTEKQPSRPLLARLIVSVPAPAENETEIFHQFSLLLQREELFTLIQDNLKKENYKNMGTLLKAVLSEELKLKGKLSAIEINAAKYYANKIQLLGFGQGKILWGVDIDVISQKINIAQVMDHAIGFKNLETEKRKQFNSIITYLKENPPILQNWDKWIYYVKCGEFIKALFHLLNERGATPPAVKAAIATLTPLINYDKNGQKPTFGT